ncbi:Similar to Inversin; acc. no. Q9Y283 [Pyronema omphalodes CBS 100304]|uniref:Similar to Inversin acc. no. Q9Y283 n=1 Tax=Pyronema omphalodes (strain CBS 100304) TaxID=1076935 RepID=U4L4Q9_PYROM|nr:Similar to Inversin; acc. no. Q9Y283 [Pyronema omphalodes CBS 100304]
MNYRGDLTISPLEPHKRHHEIKLKRLEGTGGWFLQKPEFQHWRDRLRTSDGQGNSSVLACSGIPGAGKSIICSLVIDELTSRFAHAEDCICVAHIYYDYREEQNQTHLNIITAILKQVIDALNSSSSVPEDVTILLREKFKTERSLTLEQSCRLLVQTLKQFSAFYICIDAFDECKVTERNLFLQSLSRVVKECRENCQIRIFSTGRPYIKWGEYVRSYPDLGSCCTICLEADPGDIAQYIAHQIEIDDNKDCMNDALKVEIMERIVAASDKMFLLPALQIQAVLDQTTISKRRKALQKMPIELDSAFEDTIRRIRNQKSEQATQAMDVLKWTFLSERQLSVTELRHALAVTVTPEESFSPQETLDWDNFPSEKSLFNWCLGLVILDEETSTVRLVHKSLQDYLQRQHQDGKIFQNGHSEIAYTCLKYMYFIDDNPDLTAKEYINLESWEDLDDVMRQLHESAFCYLSPEVHDIKSRLNRFSFLEYALPNWGHHARKQTTPNVDNLILGLFSNRTGVGCISTHLNSMPLSYYPDFGSDTLMRTVFSLGSYWPEMVGGALPSYGLHVAICFGLESLFHSFMRKENIDINLHDVLGRTPLMWAIAKHRDAFMHSLLERKEIDVNGHGILMMAPLSLASSVGNAIATHLLLSRDDISIDCTDDWGRTALTIAAAGGHEQIVRLLMAKKDVDVNLADICNGTALSASAIEGHGAIVRILLDRDDIDHDETWTVPFDWDILCDIKR